MQRRRFLALIAVAPVAIAACGSDGTTLPPADTTGDAAGQEVPPVESPATDVPATTNPTPATDAAVDMPGAAADVVVSLTDEGGFTTREFAFQQPPALLVTSDGRVLTAAVTPAIFPGPLLPQHMVQTIEPGGVDQLLTAAAEAGLLEELDLEMRGDVAIADAPTTVLVIDTADASVRHEAYALGIGGGPGDATESTPDRQALLGFVDRLRGDLGSIVTDGLGEPTPYEPTAVQITTVPLGGVGVELGPDATVVDWPASSPIRLDDPAILDTFQCVEIEDPEVVDVLVDATQTTYFREPGGSSGDVFQVIARPAYPGRSCDA